MTQQEFLDEVICIYKKSRQVTMPTGFVSTDKIRRGFKHDGRLVCLLLVNELSNY